MIPLLGISHKALPAFQTIRQNRRLSTAHHTHKPTTGNYALNRTKSIAQEQDMTNETVCNNEGGESPDGIQASNGLVIKNLVECMRKSIEDEEIEQVPYIHSGALGFK
jgi:hypothetical protein